MLYGFFFQAEDGIRDTSVTGVQTCALPIFPDAHPVLLLDVEPREREVALDVGGIARHRCLELGLFAVGGFSARRLARHQIGRASCRERVWGCGVGGALA